MEKSQIDKKALKERMKRVKEMRTKCKEGIYPIALELDGSVEDAKTFISIMGMTVRQAFINRMRTTLVKELKLNEMLDKKAPNYNSILKVINIIEDETVTDACEMLEGFPQAIDNVLKRETMARKFKDLIIDWEKA